MIWWILFILIVPFGYVLLNGAPYVPVKSKPLKRFLASIHVKENQHIFDLGSGDGSVLLLAASHFKMRASGVELNPLLVLFSRLRLFRVRTKTRVMFGDMWKSTIPDDIDYVYFFVLPKYIDRMAEYIENNISKPTTVISYAFEIPNKKAVFEQEGFRSYLLHPKKDSSLDKASSTQ